MAAATMNRRVASWSARLPAAGSVSGAARARGDRRGGGTVSAARAAPGSRTAPTAALMCVGVVPQHPPTSITPASVNRRM